MIMEAQELHVIFGTGPLGTWTARTLEEAGKKVRMVNRSGRRPEVHAEVELVKGDAYDANNVAALTKGATAVYQCAQPEYHEWGKFFPTLQRAIVAGSASNGARLIVAENLYMYGETGGKPLSESSPYQAHTRKGRVRQAMTEELFAAHQSGKLQVASARGSDFFGPGDSISARLTFQPALHGEVVNMLGRLDMPHTYTFVADFGRTLALLGMSERGLGRAWHVPSPAPVTQQEFITLVEQEVGKPVKVRAAGRLILGLIGLFNKTLAEMPEMLYEWNKPFVMDSSAFTQEFGLQATPLREAVRATVEWNRSAFATQLVAAHA
jgi:nucleoside-diphosphate-sugar epimerase